MNNAYFRDITEEDEQLSRDSLLFYMSIWPMVPFESDDVFDFSQNRSVGGFDNLRLPFYDSWSKIGGVELNPYVSDRQRLTRRDWSTRHRRGIRETTDQEDEAFYAYKRIPS